MKKKQEPCKIDVFKEVNEDWHGNFRIENDCRYSTHRFVRVSLLELLPLKRGKTVYREACWRVAVWGNDDMGMELDFDVVDGGGNNISEELARSLFQKIVAQKLPTKAWLKSQGLGPA